VDERGLLDLALGIAAEAGALLRDGRPDDLAVAATKSSPSDVVTEMDTRAERLITERILAVRPDDGLLGEEGSERQGTSGVRWIIDPVDGTVNYLYSIPAWAVSLGVQVDGEPAVGVVAVPPLRETFYAVRGGGAYLRRDGALAQRIHCQPPVGLDAALVATGFGYRPDRRAAQGRVLATLLPEVRDIRRGGSAAVELCSVACGRVNAYYERGTHAWDYAAGGLIATEAGCRVGGLDGAPESTEMLVAAPEPLFGTLAARLAELNAASD
jgi:myo-inositol-1(or 4)-monophosphatase